MTNWQPLGREPKDGTPFLAWREVPTFDHDTGRTTWVGEPCVAQALWGSIGSIPFHSQPQGQRFTLWASIAPPAVKEET